MLITPATDVNPLAEWRGRVEISPDAATAWLLNHNIENRRIRVAQVDRICREIAEGRWDSDHPSPILFSTTRLIDGQHRLSAIKKSGITIVSHVWCGVNDSKRRVIDTNITRTLGDRVDFVQGQTLNTIVSRVINGWDLIESTNSRQISIGRAEAIFSAHRDAIIFAARLFTAKESSCCRASVLVAAAEMFERDEQAAEVFCDSLTTVDGPVQQARVLRDWLLRQHGRTGYRMSIDLHDRSVMAMQAYLDSREIRIVKAGSWSRSAKPKKGNG